MRCPFCIEESERSTVEVGGAIVHGMFWYPYYDEDGNYHDHNPNGSGRSFHCSRGHHFDAEYRPCGSCDWGARGAVLYSVDCPASRNREHTDERPPSGPCPECGRSVSYSGVFRLDDGSTVFDYWYLTPHSVPNRRELALTGHSSSGEGF